MRTPVDAFHQALLNLQAQKQVDERSRPRRRHLPLGVMGERVVFRPAANLPQAEFAGYAGTVVDDVVGFPRKDMVNVELDNGTYLYTHIIHWVLEDPPPTEITEIEKWLAS